ncbi:MAG: 3',5'-cyclic-nucleotide phosphodiesterase [Campylobacterota bacterium]|nr:3',5'-cyclic-nucleotide phosphodiesterase [Campylobacterota bacterium]
MGKPFIKILGAYGGKAATQQLTSLQLSKRVCLDAGNIVEGMGNGVRHIDHVFITHSHLDHILDIGFLIDSTFEIRTETLKIYSRKETLESLRKHIFNWEIWPDFTQINLIDSDKKAVEFVEIELGEVIDVDGCKLKAIDNNHTKASNGFVIEKKDSALLFTSDTYCCDTIWDEVNNNKKITTVIVDVSFPSRMAQLAYDSKHLTPDLLMEEFKKLNRDDVTIHVQHIKPFYRNEIVSELIKHNLLLNNGTILETQDIVEF